MPMMLRRAALLVGAPLVAILVLRAPLINQMVFVDAWFYSGHGWQLHHVLEVFEQTYFGVRFPSILPITASTWLFGPVGGYLVVRLLVLVGTGAALLFALRRAGLSERLAATGVVLLMLNPFFLRVVLWDYVDYTMIPAAIAAVALWPRGETSAPWPAVAAGVLMAAACLSHLYAIYVIPPLLAPELLAAWRGGAGEVKRLAIRCAAATAGGLVFFLLGWLVYALYVGGVSPYDLLRPTIEFSRNVKANSQGGIVPITDWIVGELRIYAPVVVAVALVLAQGSRLLGSDAEARLGQFALLLIVELWVQRFVMASAALETWWANATFVVGMAFAVPLIVSGVAQRAGISTARACAVAIGAAAAVSAGIRWGDSVTPDLYDHLRDRPLVLALIVGASVAGLVVLRRRPAFATAALVAVLAGTTVLGLAPAKFSSHGHTGEFGANGAEELRTYAAGHRFIDEMAAGDTPAARRLSWQPLAVGMVAIVWTALPQLGGTIQNKIAPQPLTVLEPGHLAQLRYPTTASLLVMSEDHADLARARSTLAANGVKVTPEPEQEWSDGRLHVQILKVRDLPPGDNEAAVRVVAGTFLDAVRRGDGATACTLVTQEVLDGLAALPGGCPQAALRAAPEGMPGAVEIDRNTATVQVDGTKFTLAHRASEWRVTTPLPGF